MKQNRDVTIEIHLVGLTGIVFDCYAGDNQTQLPVERKMYFAGDGKTLILPALNIVSFLSAVNTTSAPKRLLPSKEYKKVAQGMLSYTSVDPIEIPFTRNGKPIQFNGFNDNGCDSKAKIRIQHAVARLDKGVPNPKTRPLLETPWELQFRLRMFPNDDVNTQIAERLFRDGGIAIGLGTFRGVFGKFKVEQWKVKETV